MADDFHDDNDPGILGNDGVDFRAVKLLHRTQPGDRAWLTFHRKRDGVFENITSWRTDELDELLPFAREELAVDSYLSVNSFHRAGRAVARHRDGSLVPRRWRDGLYPVYRSAAGARYLSSAYVDIDCHRVGLTPGAAVGRALDLQRAKTIPDASLIVLSGQGVWLFWLLRDDGPLPADRSLPPAVRAWPERVAAYQLLEHAIVRHPALVAIGADAGASDVSRITRLAGSINSTVNEPVRVLPQAINGVIPVYTLGELSARFDVRVPRAIIAAFAPTATTERSDRRVPLRANGPRARWQAVYADLLTLVRLRGGRTGEGTRNYFCCVLATTLRRLGVPLFDIRAQVHTLALASGITAVEADTTLAAGIRARGRSPSYAEISAWLHITSSEAAQLLKLGPRDDRIITTPATPRDTKQRRAALQAHIAAVVAKTGKAPTIAAAHAHLVSSGFVISQSKVGRDFVALKVPRTERRGRRSKDATLPMVFPD